MAASQTASPSGIEKAAIMLASLPQDEAIRLLGLLDDDQAKAVTIEVANLGRIAADVQSRVFTEFENEDPNAFSGDNGGRDKAMSLLSKEYYFLCRMWCHSGSKEGKS